MMRHGTISDPALAHKIAVMMMGWMNDVRKSNPALYKEAHLEAFTDAWDIGVDQISHRAPCFIVENPSRVPVDNHRFRGGGSAAWLIK